MRRTLENLMLAAGLLGGVAACWATVAAARAAAPWSAGGDAVCSFCEQHGAEVHSLTYTITEEGAGDDRGQGISAAGG